MKCLLETVLQFYKWWFWGKKQGLKLWLRKCGQNYFRKLSLFLRDISSVHLSFFPVEEILSKNILTVIAFLNADTQHASKKKRKSWKYLFVKLKENQSNLLQGQNITFVFVSYVINKRAWNNCVYASAWKINPWKERLRLQ